MGSFFPVPSLQKRCPDHVPWQVLSPPPSEGGQVQEVHLKVISLKKAIKKNVKKICFIFPPRWWKVCWRRGTGPPAQGPRKRCGTWVSCKKIKLFLSFFKKKNIMLQIPASFAPLRQRMRNPSTKKAMNLRIFFYFLNILPQSC